MKCVLALTIALMTFALAGCSNVPVAKTPKETYSSFDLPSEHPAKDSASRLAYEAQDLPLAEVLRMYGQASGRTVITGQLPYTKLTFRSAAPLTRVEAVQLLDTVLAQNGIAMVLAGDRAVKAVPAMRAPTEAPPEITLPWRLLPESSSPMSRTVHLQNLKASETVPVLMPLACLPNSIMPIDAQGILVLRDYSSNIRQQLKLLEQLDRKQTMK